MDVWPLTSGTEGIAPQGTADNVLRDYWHPVAGVEEVGEQPMAVRLLGEPLVVWRSNGLVSVFHDLCIHRGTPLSLGAVLDDGILECMYHGWQFDGTGACVRIPSLPEGRGIPTKARAKAYPVVERYGLLWVCLGKPRDDLPEFPPQFDDPQFHWDRVTQPLRANAARSLENAMDMSHFAFLHRGTLASEPLVPDIQIEKIDNGMTWVVKNPKNTMRPDGPPEWSRYTLVLPFTLVLDRYQEVGDARRILVFVNAPVSNRETKIYRFACTNIERFENEEAEAARRDMIFEQDRIAVEAQRPEELPLDLREELHLRGPDASGLEYRRLLASIGVHWG
jgi:vanillate O-demethylase monooxygenase subunit